MCSSIIGKLSPRLRHHKRLTVEHSLDSRPRLLSVGVLNSIIIISKTFIMSSECTVFSCFIKFYRLRVSPSLYINAEWMWLAGWLAGYVCGKLSAAFLTLSLRLHSSNAADIWISSSRRQTKLLAPLGRFLPSFSTRFPTGKNRSEKAENLP